MLTPAQQLPNHPRLNDAPLVVMALCANWCGTCRDFQAVLTRIALAHPEIVFAWADIEDDAELVGDIDVDDFPTLAVFKAGQPLHFGASLPIEAVVTRLLARLAQSSATPTAAPSVIPSAVRELGARLSR
ncbi:thioredoxin family protein [Thauera sp. 28]|uniref:thioredoxin family protein n=1 Tax=Thauera sp. 28 TaxID=303682 RepID=UPI0002D0C3E8|nr:thioredoxin family protein [Thauera sp. 28]ENO93474.1 thioredoxin [Thauera sp. 28]